jgi:SAM-dependent methyltransferase
VKRPVVIPEELHRNAPEVHASGPENTGAILIDLVAESLGLHDLGASDVLDVGCGVRFTQAVLNRGIPIQSYTGVDVHRPLIEYLQREVDDPRFAFAHWDAQNALYNPAGTKITPESCLPVEGTFDVLWLFSVFTHLEPSDADALLAILRRHVRPGGALFFSAFLDQEGTVSSFEDRLPAYPLSCACYSERYLRELVVANGWSVSRVSPPSPEHFIQHYLVCRPTESGSPPARRPLPPSPPAPP